MFSCYQYLTTIIFHCVLCSETLLYIKNNPMSINCLSARRKGHPYEDQGPQKRFGIPCTGKHPEQLCCCQDRYGGVTQVRLSAQHTAASQKDQLHSSKLSTNTNNNPDAQVFQVFPLPSLFSHAYV